MPPPRLVRVVAVLASAPGEPGGDTGRVLHLLVPLTTEGSIDSASFAQVGTYCHAALVQNDALVWESALLRTDRGWAVRPGSTEESPTWPLQAGRLRPGDYLALTDPKGAESSFRIVNVDQH